MLRTKRDVEKHVNSALSKIDNENERNLRGYTCARLYFQVKDYETAKKYLSSFLSVRDHHAPSHKLMAEIYEATGNIENALQCYKRSLEIDSQQKEIVLKICEMYCQLPVDHETARYWADRAEQIFPHHNTIFKLRECLVSAEGEPDREELENLIATELAAQPKNVDLRIKLLRLYLDTERVKEAYDHVVKIESKKLFLHSIDWYYLLGDVFEAYQEEFSNDLDTQFYINFLSSLDHLISLTVAEPHSMTYENGKKLSSITDAAAVLHSFDQQLKKAHEKDVREGSWVYFLQHMKGQLYFHMASLIMKRAKKDQGNWKEACRFSSALFLVGYTFKPSNLLQEIWFSKMEDNQKLFTNFFQGGAVRTSFTGHVIMNLCNEDKSKWLQKIKQDVCLPQVRERICNRLFGSITQKEKLSSSYFVQDSTFIQCSLEFPTQKSLQEYNKSTYKLCCDSLHRLVWLQLHQEIKNPTARNETNLSEVFKGLQYSNKNLLNGSVESLCILDLEAYLQATTYQARSIIEQKLSMHNERNQHSPLCFPPDISDALCSKQQSNWWYSAYGLFSCVISEKLGEHRRNLQHGLEVIRGLGNHGLEIQLVVHLSHYFADKADYLTKDKEKTEKTVSADVIALEARAIHYWNIALGMLEKLSSGQTLRIPRDQMFVSSEKKLSADEIDRLREEGKLYLAVNLMNSGKLDEAAEILNKLMSPYASYYLALILKKTAFKEEKSSNARTVLLNKAKNALHETMDRIKDDKNHLLNKDIFVELEDVECELAKDLNSYKDDNAEACDETDVYDDVDSSPGHNSSFDRNGTPSRMFPNISSHSTPKPSSSFNTVPKSKHQYSKERQHLQPSPERLDAQIRALTLSQDILVKTVLQQQQAILETNKAIVEGLKQNKDVVQQITKQLEELQVTNLKLFTKKTKKSGLMKGQGDDEDEYEYDANGLLEYYTEDGNEDFRASGYGFDQSRLMHEATAPAPINYVVSPAIPPGPPPALGHYNYQYPPHPALPQPPPTAVAERPYYHPTPGQGLPFSEGQQLPQFHFHVASPVVKPPVISNISSLPQTLPPQPVIPQSTGQIPVASPWMKPVGVPHAFQIPLPTTSIAPPVVVQQQTSQISSPLQTTVSSSSQSELKTLLNAPSSGSLSFSQITVKSPVVSVAELSSGSPSIFAGMAASPEVKKLERSRCDSEVAGSSDVEAHDLEREVMGDFKPLIPLPAEVVVETGEENEVVLFEDRAKLYRFVEQEWKERGIGVVKILHHESSGRVRLLMRRDQVLKVCANHYITSKMEIHSMKSSDKAWTWVAQDFADEELKPESFCIRFKTTDLALAYKNAFEKALTIAKQAELKFISTPKTTPGKSPSVGTQEFSFGTKFLAKAGSWNCPTCYVNNSGDKLLCVACETEKPGLNLVSSTSAECKPVTSVVFQPATLNTQQSSFINNNVDQQAFTDKPFSIFSKSNVLSTVSESTKNTLGGFTFTTSPMIQETKDNEAEREILVVSTKSKNGPQVTKITPKTSPFSGFSFKTSPSSNIVTVTSSHVTAPLDTTPVSKPMSKNPQAIFGSNTAVTNLDFSSLSSSTSSFLKGTKESPSTLTPASPIFVKVSKDGRRVSLDGITENTPEEFIPTAEFKPVVPLPALVDTKTGEENEEKLFGERAKLFRFDSELKEWKERGVGELKILHQKDNQKYRILMRRDQVLKLCANHYIIPDMKLISLASSDKSWSWCAQDYSEGSLTQEKFAAKFKTSDISKRFFDVFAQCQSSLKTISERNSKTCDSKSIPKDPCVGNSSSFNQLFKPLQDTWECSSCNKSNLSNQSSCSHCNASKVDCTTTNTNYITVESKPFSEIYKPEPGSWECGDCYVRNKSSDIKCVSCGSSKAGSDFSSDKPAFGNKFSSDTKQQSLADIFKPQPGSWECESCYVRNKSSEAKCVSCGSSKSGVNSTTNEKPVFGNVFSSDSKKPSFADLFKLQSESWECPSCNIKNSVDKTNCSSCQTAKSVSTVPKSTESNQGVFGKFQFGSSPSSAYPGPSAFPGFSFGQRQLPQGEFVFGIQQASQPSTFSFGVSAVNSTNEEKGEFGGEIFGSNKSSNTASTVFGGERPNSGIQTKSVSIPISSSASGFSFGDSTPNSSDAPTKFCFGSPQKYEFSFSGVRPRSPSKTPKSPRSPATPSDVEDDEEVESSDVDNIYFQPVIPLPPKVETKTGEENESILFCKRAKLFRFTNSEWKERGIGDIKILFDESQKKARLLMRRDQVLKVCLNHSLTREISFDWRGEKSLTWAATDFSEAEPSPELLAVRFKTHELALEFKETIEKANNLVEGKSIPLKDEKTNTTPTTSAELFSFKMNSDKNDTSPSSFSSLASRFGTSSLPTKSLFGNTSSMVNNAQTLSPEGKPTFSFGSKETQNTSSFFTQKQFDSDSSPSACSEQSFKLASPKTGKSQEKENTISDDDIQIVYQALADSEDKALAEKLLLPPTFFRYKLKEPCKGCIGCEDRIPDYKSSMATGDITRSGEEVNLPTSSDSLGDAQTMFLNTTAASFSFADLASKSGITPQLPQSNSAVKNVFAGAGTPLFANLNNSTEGDEDADAISQGPDIHFEPIIPLPELIDVKTGEEDEIPIFVNRAKLYRYDTTVKQWKERGVGEFKILQHKEKLSFRLILRRDQVHKVACNHCITESMELNPMNTSETSLCWNAVDYAEGHPDASHFAIKFKTKELLIEFRNKFEECKLKLSQRNKEGEVTENTFATSQSEQIITTVNQNNTTKTEDTAVDHSSSDISSIYRQQSEEEYTESETVDETDEEEDDLIFEKRVSLEIYDESEKKFKCVGLGRLTVYYDDDVYGYRIAILGDNKTMLCDHIIAIQTSLRVDKKKAIWAALDMSIEPPRQRQFQASFSSLESVTEFSKVFEDGKEIAVHSEIVEKTDFLPPSNINRS